MEHKIQQFLKPYVALKIGIGGYIFMKETILFIYLFVLLSFFVKVKMFLSY